MRFKVLLNHVNDVALFVAKCAEFDCDINYSCGKRFADAKSLLGVLYVGMGEVSYVDLIVDGFPENIRKKYERTFLDEMKMWVISDE